MENISPAKSAEQKKIWKTDFGITLGIVSSDLTLFQQLYPDAMRYDKNVKSYMAERTPYRRRRKGAWVEAINWEIVTKIA